MSTGTYHSQLVKLSIVDEVLTEATVQIHTAQIQSQLMATCKACNLVEMEC